MAKAIEKNAATRQEKVAIIPNRPGEYVLPEMKIPWWNTSTDKLEIEEKLDANEMWSHFKNFRREIINFIM